MDGLIITRNSTFAPVSSGNPKHSVAFKVNSFGQETVVKSVDYQITKYGKLIPLVRCEPVTINGASVSNVTGNNAKFIVDNRINVGTRVRIILSGEIIPKMVYIQSELVLLEHFQLLIMPGMLLKLTYYMLGIQ